MPTVCTMSKKIDKAKKIFIKASGILSMSSAIGQGIHRRELYKMCNEGILEVIGRGLYRLTEYPLPSDIDLVTVGKLVPKGVVSLISALSFYDLTTQIPRFIYIAIPNKSRKPIIHYPPVKFFWFSEKQYKNGIKTISIDGHSLKIYDMEKTLVDCWRFRNKIGLDVALEALKTYFQLKKNKINKILEYAQICRVEKTLRPILETIING
ncbi:MAG: hypothetical protein K1060chlam1_01221 [Candidatus Anoxychlamydiales bacterium]|nr:hypothetical protein [Candidatus Anoxychlamydiales bacterium]